MKMLQLISGKWQGILRPGNEVFRKEKSENI
jgi:hypothetical protein